MSQNIHSTAIISKDSSIGDECSIGPYAILEEGVKVGDKCQIEAHVIIKKGTNLGNCVKVGHFSAIGGDPQHLDFDDSIQSNVTIGDHVRISEGVTVHRSIYQDGSTLIGSGSFLMGNSHVGHDGKLGKEVILANGALLGGHVTVGDHTFVGGGAGVHQFSRIGNHVMVGGLAEISKDVPPCIIVAGRNQSCGLNFIGLKRKQISDTEIKALKYVYKSILMKSGNPSDLAKNILNEDIVSSNNFAKQFAEFFFIGDRGFVRSRSATAKN